MQTSVRQARMPKPAATESPKGGRTRRRGREGRKEWWKGWRAEKKSESVDRESGQGEMREDRRLGKKKRCERGR